jgi:hypothetical protein
MKYLLIIYFGILFLGCSNSPHIYSQNDREYKREFSQSITRVFSNEFEEQLLKKAESIYPPRDSVLAIGKIIKIDSIPETGYWFYRTIDGIKIPYAITTEAVNYYSNKIEELYNDSTSSIYNAKFTYKAEIKFYETFKIDVDRISSAIKQPYNANNVYVVEMSMEWHHSCGNLCGLAIWLKRVVVFDSKGMLLKVFYDRSASVLGS